MHLLLSAPSRVLPPLPTALFFLGGGVMIMGRSPNSSSLACQALFAPLEEQRPRAKGQMEHGPRLVSCLLYRLQEETLKMQATYNPQDQFQTRPPLM